MPHPMSPLDFSTEQLEALMAGGGMAAAPP